MNWLEYIPYNDAQFKEQYPQFASMSALRLKRVYDNQVLVSMTTAIACALRLAAPNGREAQHESCAYVAELLLAGVMTNQTKPLVVGTPSFTGGKDVKTAISVAKKLGITGIANFNIYLIEAFEYIAAALKLNPVPYFAPAYKY